MDLTKVGSSPDRSSVTGSETELETGMVTGLETGMVTGLETGLVTGMVTGLVLALDSSEIVGHFATKSVGVGSCFGVDRVETFETFETFETIFHVLSPHDLPSYTNPCLHIVSKISTTWLNEEVE